MSNTVAHAWRVGRAAKAWLEHFRDDLKSGDSAREVRAFRELQRLILSGDMRARRVLQGLASSGLACCRPCADTGGSCGS